MKGLFNSIQEASSRLKTELVKVTEWRLHRVGGLAKDESLADCGCHVLAYIALISEDEEN